MAKPRCNSKNGFGIYVAKTNALEIEEVFFFEKFEKQKRKKPNSVIAWTGNLALAVKTSDWRIEFLEKELNSALKTLYGLRYSVKIIFK